MSEDGQSFIDDGSLAYVTIRDPAGTVLGTAPAVGTAPVTARRMGVEQPGFPETQEEATPED